MLEKQELLFNQVKSAHNVLEIGTYMGHSALIMLLANPSLKITCIDIDDKYSRPALSVLEKYFPGAVTFMHGDSLSVLSKLQDTYDFFHVDGHHTEEYVRREFEYIKTLSSTPVLRIIFDDQDCMKHLQREITGTRVMPTCRWNNVYYEIDTRV